LQLIQVLITRRIGFALLVAGALALHAQTPDCASWPPWSFQPSFHCNANLGTCPIGQPVTFEIIPFHANAPVSCVSKVVWKFPDGDVTVNPYAPQSKTLPPGAYDIPVDIYNSAHSSAPRSTSIAWIFVGRGSINVAAVAPEVTEGGTLTFSLARSVVEGSTTAHWAITESPNSTTPTPDFSPSSGMATLVNGQQFYAVSLPIADDTTYRGDKVYYIKLLSATNDYIPIPGYGTFVLRENDYATIEIATRPFVVNESAGQATVDVRRTGNLSMTIGVTYSTYGYGIETTSGTLIFNPGETLKTITIPIENDNRWTGGHSLIVGLLQATAGGLVNSLARQISLFVVEDEPPPKWTIDNLALPELDSGAQNVRFTLKLSEPVTRHSIHYVFLDGTAGYGSDYYGYNPGVLYLDGSDTYTIPFYIAGDTVREPHETFKIHFYYSEYSPDPLPPDATITILNDDTELAPAIARIGKGQSLKYSLDIGLPAAVPLTLPLRASNAAIMSLPASVQIPAGKSLATFEVTGVSAGVSKISVTLPPENGGETLSTGLTVHESATALFEPKGVTVFTGEERTVGISLSPASAQTERLQLTVGNPNFATVPAEVTIPPGGTGTFTVKGIAPGATYVNATLPAFLGEGYVTTSLDVIDRPPTPAVISIEPASGSTNGGTTFLARGSLLTADCRLLFGDTPAASLTLTSEGMLSGTTPPHAPGAVDVVLQCGTNPFVLTKAFTFVGAPRTRSARH
jgi:IPT/TIG domain-containing protein/Calx-beta domain-containing protein